MGIIERFSDIMKSNINALLDKAENPEKMIDQMLRDARENLAKVKSETAGVNADVKAAKRQLDAQDEKIAKYKTAAENALKSGQEADARKLIATKQQLEATRATLETSYLSAKANADKMNQLYEKLVNDIQTLENRRGAIKATMAAAKTQSHINKMTAGIDTGSSLEAFDRMEQKANRMLDQAQAEADLNAHVSSADDLADKYATGTGGSVDDELAEMRRNLGL